MVYEKYDLQPKLAAWRISFIKETNEKKIVNVNKGFVNTTISMPVFPVHGNG